MPTKAEIIDVAYNFLKAVADVLKLDLGEHTKRLQRSTWMVPNGPNTMSSQQFTREIFNRIAASMLYQTKFVEANPQQLQQLEKNLVAAGIPRAETKYSYLLPLVHHWLDSPDPLAFDRKEVDQMLEEFADAVIDEVVLTKSRYAIISLNLTSEPLILEKGISIRPISNEELWDLGDIENVLSSYRVPSTGPYMQSEDWKILDIELKHKRDGAQLPRAIEAIRGAVLVALGLVSPGALQIYDLGTTVSYGIGATGIAQKGESVLQLIGRWSGQYTLNVEQSKRLKTLWRPISKILTSERHYLRIPALRLYDGGCRSRYDDAIVDYAIGLEALLLKGVNTELSYRFALRGATILAWDSGEKETIFNELRDFYEARSNIVHGGYIDITKLTNARSCGERALRDIWWWYFNSGESLSHALKRVDLRILQ